MGGGSGLSSKTQHSEPNREIGRRLNVAMLTTLATYVCPSAKGAQSSEESSEVPMHTLGRSSRCTVQTSEQLLYVSFGQQ